jgi:DNA repair exonuclease SbcCD ATPase subunit
MGGPELEREIDDLYAQPPEAFTQARDALAKRLKAEGDDDAARRVRALRKPVRSAWAVNRLVREDRPAVESLVEVGERLRAAQRRALSGTGADELRERSEERRRLVSGLTQRAGELLGDGEPPAGATEDIAATLEAASVDEDAAKAVLDARLTKPLPRPAGFGDVFGLRPVEGGREAAAGPEPAKADERARREERRRRERELRAAEERERDARERVERLRGTLEDLQQRVSSLKDEIRAAEAEARGASVAARRLRR